MIVDGKAGPGTAGGDTIAEADRRAACATRTSRRWSCGSTARAARSWPPNASARRCSRPRPRRSRSWFRWATSPLRAAIGSRPRPTSFIAEPSTITGSIGVFGVLPSFQGTLQKLGIGADGMKTTPLSGEPDLLQGPLARGQPLIQAGVDATYRAVPLHRRRLAAQVARRQSTRSPRAGCGTAAPRASSASSTALAE